MDRERNFGISSERIAIGVIMENVRKEMGMDRLNFTGDMQTDLRTYTNYLTGKTRNVELVLRFLAWLRVNDEVISYETIEKEVVTLLVDDTERIVQEKIKKYGSL